MRTAAAGKTASPAVLRTLLATILTDLGDNRSGLDDGRIGLDNGRIGLDDNRIVCRKKASPGEVSLQEITATTLAAMP